MSMPCSGLPRILSSLNSPSAATRGVPLETRGAIGRYDAARGILEMHGAAKVPHRNQELLARMLKIPPSSIHVYESHVGGGFGIRGEMYPEDFLVCVAAKKFGRPVKWIEDRREHLICANHSRQQLHKIRAAVDDNGVILAIDDTYFHDQGAYIRTHATRVVHMTAGILPGPYRVPAYRAIGHFRLTNKTPAATYRAPGRYETTFVRERLLDAIAAKLTVDRIEVRRRNAITTAELPYERPLEALGESIFMDTGDYIGLVDKQLARIDWQKLNAEVKRRKQAGELIGIGVAMFIEKSGLGPADGVRISVDTSGAVEVVTGGASLGQGFETVMAQVAADELGVDYKKCRVIHGQTDRIAFGIGAHASRATVMTASATHIAALNVRKKALEVAGELLQAPPDMLDIVDGEVVRTDRAGGPSIGLGTIAQHSAPTSKTLGEREPGLTAEGWFRVDHQVYPYGSHVAVVRVDRRNRRRHRRALFHRLRHRPRHQPGFGRGADRRRLCARAGRRAVRGVYLQRARRSARRDLRRLSHCRPCTRRQQPDVLLREDYADAAQSARHQGRRRERHHRRRGRDCLGDRRRHRHAGRGDADPGDAAAAETDFKQAPQPHLIGTLPRGQIWVFTLYAVVRCTNLHHGLIYLGAS